MTVLQVLALHPYKLGSFEEYILAFSETMHERRHDVVYVFRGEPHPFISEKLRALGHEYFIQPDPQGPREFARFIKRLVGIIRKRRVDIIQAQFFPHSNFAVLAGFLTRTPVYQTIHTLSTLNPGPVRPVSKIKSRVSALMSEKVFAVSDAVRKDLIEVYGVPPEKIEVLFNAVSLGKYEIGASSFSLHDELGIKRDCKIILTIAHARHEKGLEYLIRAVPAVVEKHPEAHFVFCGGGPLENYLVNLTAETGVSHNVHFLGVRNDIPALLRDCYAATLPSLTEAIGYALIEAMAMGKAVVATNVGGIPELVLNDKTGILVPPGNPGSLANAVNDLIDNPEKTESLGKDGRRRIEEEFELDRRVLTEIEIYEKFLDGRK